MCFDLSHVNYSDIIHADVCVCITDQKRVNLCVSCLEISICIPSRKLSTRNVSVHWTTEASHHVPISLLLQHSSSHTPNNFLFFPINHQGSRKSWGVWRKFAFVIFSEKSNWSSDVFAQSRERHCSHGWNVGNMDFVYVLSGNCSGMSSMLQMPSDLPETEFHLLNHQPPVSTHTLAVTIKYVAI